MLQAAPPSPVQGIAEPRRPPPAAAGVALFAGGSYVVSLFGVLWAGLMKSAVWEAPRSLATQIRRLRQEDAAQRRGQRLRREQQQQGR